MELRQLGIAILGYGNQGRAHALNLRDAGFQVSVGSRSGKGFDRAIADGFSPTDFSTAVSRSQVVLFLLPDSVIPIVHGELYSLLTNRYIGFAHGYAMVFGGLVPAEGASYFLAAPKGAGAILRENFLNGTGLPVAYAVAEGAPRETEELARQYALAIGRGKYVFKTRFREEVECDLFGEQAVLCGGLIQLMEAAFKTLVKNGHSREMAFFETCYEAKLILDLFLKFGPEGMSRRISPTAFFGGLTRGHRLITPALEQELEKIFQEIRSGRFADEWKAEVQKGCPKLEAERSRLQHSDWQKTFEDLPISSEPR